MKFTPEGGRVVVRVGATRADIEIAVTDTGVGIRRLLAAYLRAIPAGGSSISRRFGGLGLGLSIVKYLVDLHGGTIKAESPGEGKGATFTVVLPRGSSAADSAPAGNAGARTDSMAQASDALNGMRILIVDDEKDTLDFVSRFLASYGAEVVAAASAAEAIALVSTAGANVLISDIGLPDVDGYELLQRIRRLEVGAGGIPAIALTAYARTEDRRLAFRAGYQAHLAKPVEPTELVATIVDLARLSRTPTARR